MTCCSRPPVGALAAEPIAGSIGPAHGVTGRRANTLPEVTPRGQQGPEVVKVDAIL